MLTKLTIRNFKRLGSVEVELGQNVVLIGPNNSGKTSALQALTLWDVGLRQWLLKRTPQTQCFSVPCRSSRDVVGYRLVESERDSLFFL